MRKSYSSGTSRGVKSPKENMRWTIMKTLDTEFAEKSISVKKQLLN